MVELDGEVDVVERAQDLVDLADLRLVLEEDGRIEVRDLGVRRLAHHLALARVHERAKHWRHCGACLRT